MHEQFKPELPSHPISTIDDLAECARADRMEDVEKQDVERLCALEAEFVELRALLGRCVRAVTERPLAALQDRPRES
jgi:hypothetical protein